MTKRLIELLADLKNLSSEEKDEVWSFASEMTLVSGAEQRDFWQSVVNLLNSL